jgi:hypothetical protein
MSFDAFNLTFDTLRLAIQDGHKFATESEHHRLIENFESVFSAYATTEAQTAATNKLAYVQELRKERSRQLFHQQHRLNNNLDVIKATAAEAHCHCEGFSKETKRRRVLQRETAEKRMRELVYEIIGEYGKCQWRVERRKQYIRISMLYGKLLSIWRLAWQRYLLRLRVEVSGQYISHAQHPNALSCALLCPQRDSDEGKAVSILLNRAKGLPRSADGVGSWKVLSAAKLSRSIIGNEGVAAVNKGAVSERLTFAKTNSEMAKFSHILARWAGVGTAKDHTSGARRLGSATRRSSSSTNLLVNKQQSASKGKEAFMKLSSFLRSNSISWMHPPSYCVNQFKQLAVDYSAENSNKLEPLEMYVYELHLQQGARIENDRLYFCMEERELACWSQDSPLNKEHYSFSVQSAEPMTGFECLDNLLKLQVILNFGHIALM